MSRTATSTGSTTPRTATGSTWEGRPPRVGSAQHHSRASVASPSGSSGRDNGAAQAVPRQCARIMNLHLFGVWLQIRQLTAQPLSAKPLQRGGLPPGHGAAHRGREVGVEAKPSKALTVAMGTGTGGHWVESPFSVNSRGSAHGLQRGSGASKDDPAFAAPQMDDVRLQLPTIRHPAVQRHRLMRAAADGGLELRWKGAANACHRSVQPGIHQAQGVPRNAVGAVRENGNSSSICSPPPERNAANGPAAATVFAASAAAFAAAAVPVPAAAAVLIPAAAAVPIPAAAAVLIPAAAAVPSLAAAAVLIPAAAAVPSPAAAAVLIPAAAAVPSPAAAAVLIPAAAAVPIPAAAAASAAAASAAAVPTPTAAAAVRVPIVNANANANATAELIATLGCRDAAAAAATPRLPGPPHVPSAGAALLASAAPELL
ncbi:hypothetical protein TSOC_004379 [Tetrabaena socialis]|uniref:Uncharacterized protein n=1 Tax=Tetrabaena socialis TaxID=47790 RepID=A0A2J8A9A7_9CHLO|nr:hypothetical protein TSOC_004379 [Tetrabaena socialis]|eukprot:PNH09063.1 hypothetical protein TSOC_004379 [Tetrabaena socialis]